MNAPVTTAALDETQRIERALDALLKLATDNLHPPWPAREDGLRHVGAILSEMLARTPAEQAASELLANPVAEAARQGIRTLGERLFEIGGHKLMTDVLYRVAERDRAHENRRIGIMDHRWDGIGGPAGWIA